VLEANARGSAVIRRLALSGFTAFALLASVMLSGVGVYLIVHVVEDWVAS